MAKEGFSLKGKRVLVTGGAGFLGSFLIDRLKEFDPAEITIPRSKEVDLTVQEETSSLFSSTKPQVVFHLAAKVGGIGANKLNPGLFFSANLSMGMNVVEESLQNEVEKLIFLGTTCSYPKFAPVPFHEDDLFNGYPEETNAPYGIAKRSLLVMIWGYGQQYGLRSIYLIPANLYGPRDNFDLETSHVIPAMVRKFVEAEESGSSVVNLWGSGEPTREFLYVEDCADAIILAAQHYERSDPVNLGTGQEVSVSNLATTVRDIVGFSGSISWDKTRPDGQPRRRLDVTKAKKEFGFEAKTSLHDGIAKTVDWFRHHRQPDFAGAGVSP